MVVAADGLRKAFGRTQALDGLTLRITRGEKYGLLGPNGSGKTTLIRTIAGLLSPDSGDVRVLDQKVPSAAVAARVGYMTQVSALYEDLTPRENLRFFAALFGVPAREVSSRIDEVLDLVNLTARADSPVRTLSGGLRQRTSLAAALVHRPELMLLDEPTVGTDPEVRRGLWQRFDRMNAEGRTFIISTHVMDEAERCSRVGLLRSGRLLAEGSPARLKEQTGAASLEEAYLWFAERAGAAERATAEGGKQ
jgi:ABC-2 type transport system ATP-binding protein